jgi:hypothetical protein
MTGLRRFFEPRPPQPPRPIFYNCCLCGEWFQGAEHSAPRCQACTWLASLSWAQVDHYLAKLEASMF